MRKRIRLLAAFAAALLSAAPTTLSPQAADAASLPHPTRLRVATRGTKVELSWADAAAAEGGNAVYRHVERIGEASFAYATRIGTVDKGLQAYSDSPPDGASYYYAVLSLSATGQPYKAFLSPGNVTGASISVDLPMPPSPAAAPALAPAPAPQPAAKAVPIEAISAQAKGDSIVVTYRGGSGLGLVVYRGSSPIARSSDLLDASLIATFVDKDGSFVDYPVPGIEYWYAILLEEDLKVGRIQLTKGKNTTAAAARVALTKRSEALAESSPSSRNIPLPAFLLDSATGVALPSTPMELPERASLSPESEKALVSIMTLSPAVERPRPALKVLPEELAQPSGGEDYALSLIVSQKLARGDWAASVDQLRKYLSLNRGEKAAARAHFYLGEALAFTGSYRDAFFEFLSSRSHYPRESAPWIEYSLAALRRKEE